MVVVVVDWSGRVGPGRTHRLVFGQVERLELRQAHEVHADEEPEVAPLPLATLEFARVAQVLHAHPQLVHLAEVQQHKLDRVRHRAARRRRALRRAALRLGPEAKIRVRSHECTLQNSSPKALLRVRLLYSNVSDAMCGRNRC